MQKIGRARAAAALVLAPAAARGAPVLGRRLGPPTPALQPAWLRELEAEREVVLKAIGWEGGVFGVPELRWTQTAYIQPQMHPYDRFFYDDEKGNYTVQRYLADLRERYGGIDALLMWPTYTNIGADDRNQFDLFRAMPGGLDGVARVTRELHDAGVRVLWPYNPWDMGTRREDPPAVPGVPGYRAYPGANAYAGHGGTDIDILPATGTTPAQCAARCDADPRCGCVTYLASNGGCWRRGACDPAHFANASGTGCLRVYGYGCDYTVYVKAPGAVAAGRPGRSDEETFAALLRRTGGDGINGDTMLYMPRSFWDAAERVDYPIAFEPEADGADWALNWSTMGWGYWNTQDGGYPKVPCVDRFKFLTRGKFLTNVCDRWRKSKVDPLQMAWFNGDGIESWENVWGTWNGIVPRDGEAIRRVGKMLRYFGKEGFLQSPGWEPHDRSAVQPGVYASRWPLPGRNATLWTLVNRAGSDVDAPQLAVAAGPGRRYYDCYHGAELTPSAAPPAAPQLSFAVEAGGYGCVVETGAAWDGLAAFLRTMRNLTQRPLASYSAEWQYLNQTLVPVEPTPPAAAAPAGTVLVPKGRFRFETSGVEIEGDDDHGVDVQYPWEAHPQRHHARDMDVGPFYIDKFPVTCSNYSAYLSATGYRAEDTYNWLKNWGGAASCPAPLADVPVTYVSLKEARRYCSWAHGGARLPRSWEWQYAAQGADGRAYPWGDEKDQARFPVPRNGTVFEGPEPVTRHAPAGDSPFGVSDLVGNVWQYTDEFRDAHTRAVVVRGGSNYRPAGSKWYFPQALELSSHNKYFLMDDRYERAGTIGFRCVVDAADR